MGDPFAEALAALFGSVMASAAVYTPAAGLPVAVNVIRSRQTIEQVGVGGRIAHDTDTVEVRVCDVVQPVRGDVVTIAGATFVVDEEPQLDAEGLTWRFGIVAA